MVDPIDFVLQFFPEQQEHWKGMFCWSKLYCVSAHPDAQIPVLLSILHLSSLVIHEAAFDLF